MSQIRPFGAEPTADRGRTSQVQQRMRSDPAPCRRQVRRFRRRWQRWRGERWVRERGARRGRGRSWQSRKGFQAETSAKDESYPYNVLT